MVNRVILMGNLGKDPEIKEFDNGSVANFSMATNERYKDRNGNPVDKTEWHNIRVGRPGLVELVKKYFKKGDPMYLEGKIRTRSYEKDGQTRYITEIDVDNIRFVPRSNVNGPEANNQSGAATSSSATPDDFNIDTNNQIDDDLPF